MRLSAGVRGVKHDLRLELTPSPIGIRQSTELDTKSDGELGMGSKYRTRVCSPPRSLPRWADGDAG
jgi:hypothetical protein